MLSLCNCFIHLVLIQIFGGGFVVAETSSWLCSKPFKHIFTVHTVCMRHTVWRCSKLVATDCVLSCCKYYSQYPSSISQPDYLNAGVLSQPENVVLACWKEIHQARFELEECILTVSQQKNSTHCQRCYGYRFTCRQVQEAWRWRLLCRTLHSLAVLQFF